MPSPVEEDAKHIRPCVPGCLCKRSLGSSKLLLWHILCIVLLPFWHILFIVLLPLSSKVQMITWCALLGPGNSFHTCCNLTCNSTSVVKNHTHACTHARTHARMHACTHARTHACTHTHLTPNLCVWLLTGLWHQRSWSGGDTCPPPAALTLMSLTLWCSARRSPCQRECQLVVLERLQWLPFYWWRAVSEALKCALNILLRGHSRWSQFHLLGGLWTFSSPTGSCSCSGLFLHLRVLVHVVDFFFPYRFLFL